MDIRDNMLEMVVVGVIAPFGRGVVRSCVECRASVAHPQPCHGFGPGCLVAPRPIDAPKR